MGRIEMIANEDTPLWAFLRSIMQLLVNKNYVALERMSSANRLSALDMEQAVSAYGRTLVMPPVGKFCPDIVPITGNEACRWSVVLPLFSNEEGPSDLSLGVQVRLLDNKSYELEIEDLHVR
jgi:hypothetical protein